MPSVEETTRRRLIEMPDKAPPQSDAFLARDVDLLVSQIKENLRLSGLKTKSTVGRTKNRPKPYQVPSNAYCEICRLRPSQRKYHKYHHPMWTIPSRYCDGCQKSKPDEDEDPNDVLQLLRQGVLIREAVRRLQRCEDRTPSSEEEEEEEEDVGVNVAGNDENEPKSAYRRKPFFYDSDDEPLYVIP